MVVISCWKGSKQIRKYRPTGVALLEAECVTFRVKAGVYVEPVVLGVGWTADRQRAYHSQVTGTPCSECGTGSSSFQGSSPGLTSGES